MKEAAIETSTQTAAAKPASAAKGGSGRDNVAWRATSTGRNIVLVTTDLIPGRPLRLWGAVGGACGGLRRGAGAGLNRPTRLVTSFIYR